MRLTPHCAERLRQKAEQEGLSYGAVIALVLEEWFRESNTAAE